MTVSLVARLRLCNKGNGGSWYAFLTGDLREALSSLLLEKTPSQVHKQYRNPMVLAQKWQGVMDAGKAHSRADLARQVGVSRAYVTQVLRLLSMARSVQEVVLALGDPIQGRIVGGHTLRSLAKLPVEEQQLRIARLIALADRSGSLSTIAS